MKKVVSWVWKIAQWIIAVSLGIAALGAFVNSLGAGLCWLASAIFICPLSRMAIVKLFTKKKGSRMKDALLKKNKGSVNSLLCGALAVVFLFMGSEALPKTETINPDDIAGTMTVASSSDDSQEQGESIEGTEETEKSEKSEESASVESSDAEQVESSEVEAPESESPSSEEKIEPVVDQPIVDEPVVSDMEVHFIDVGQADAALVLCGGEAMLIDGGNTGDSSLIYAYLKDLEISHLDYMIATHAHEDHVGGLAGALNYADVDTVYCPVTEYDSKAFSNFKKYVENRDAQITIPSVGDTFELGNAEVEILGLNAGNEVNDTSIILKITHGEVSFLFTGDAEREAEQVALNSGCDLSSTVLKVGHHGSAESTTYPFLREIMPTYAVISVGEDNSYGHPTEEALSRLRDAEVKVYRTDLQGHIVAVSDTKNVTISVEKNPDADTLAPTVITKPESTPESSADVEEKPSTQKGTTYVLNTNTMKFHETSCSSVKAIKDENYAEYVGTAKEVEAMGYVGCKRCNPR